MWVGHEVLPHAHEPTDAGGPGWAPRLWHARQTEDSAAERGRLVQKMGPKLAAAEEEAQAGH